MVNENLVKDVVKEPYKYGFVTDIETEKIEKGLNEDIIKLISQKKEEPKFLLDFRLKAFKKWQKMKEPDWAALGYKKIDYQDIIYYSAPKQKEKISSLDEVDPKLLETFDKLGIPLTEQKKLTNVAVDAVFDSVSIATTFREELAEHGVIFCSISEAVKNHADLIEKYLGTVVPASDNYFAALNSAVFSDGSFVYIPKGVTCPMDLSSYFRINSGDSGQFERTLIIAEESSSVSYLEGCTAPMFDTNTLHAAVVELIALDDASIKYSTVQNWYAGDEEGIGGIFNFVTKRGKCLGKRSKISWSQVETGSALTYVQEKQNIDQKVHYDQDVVNILTEGKKSYIQVFNVLKGVITSRHKFTLDTTPEVLEDFVKHYYSIHYIPNEIILPQKLEDQEITVNVIQC